MPPDSEPDFVATMKALQVALGDKDLAKQIFSDANAADRQTRQNHFEARIEYVRQMAERTQATEASIKGIWSANSEMAVFAQCGRDRAGASLCR